MIRPLALLFLIALGQGDSALGQAFQLPTPNSALFEPGREADYFTPTVGRTWPSGTFGCVRSEGWQMHEGLDIKCIQRDEKGEPIDPISAAADGVIVYINAKPGLSNYGNYIVMKHTVDGLTVYTLYAHLRKITDGLRVGHFKKTGEIIAVMGRTANTRQGISRERAHLHFEINLLANDDFPTWYKNNFPGQRNDHGMWNGQNLIGIDPWKVFMEQRNANANKRSFSLLQFIQSQPLLCRLKIRKANLDWAKRFPQLLSQNIGTNPSGAYEIHLNTNGLPIKIIPINIDDLEQNEVRLIEVNPEVYKAAPCRKLVFKKGQQWVLTAKGKKHAQLITE
tara:strand:+ start:783 stop:1793 length:1011 start_codon:yes stop_codon:yes gene_type:complete